MMVTAAVTAVYLDFLRTDLVLGLWAIGITLPAFLWVLETERVAGFRGQALTVADRFVAFSRALMLTVAVYAGVVLATLLTISLLCR